MTENYVDPTRDAFRAFRSLNGEGEIHMLNLVRLRQTAVYPQQHARHGQAVSGEEAYRAYGEESGPILKAVGGSIAYRANFEFVLIAPDNERRHNVFIDPYPSTDAFVSIIHPPAYQQAVVHPQAPLCPSRFIHLIPQPPATLLRSTSYQVTARCGLGSKVA
mgnify:CR=1 FL=1